MLVASFPHTPSGKLDRKALPPPDVTAQEADIASLAPRTPTEEVLARFWCEMLDLKQVGMRDNFFELGGHSILAVRVIHRINETLGVKLGIIDLFRFPTIEALAASIEQNLLAGNRGPQVILLQAGHTGLPLYLIGAGPDEYRIAHSIGKDRAIYAIESPMPAEWRHAITIADRTALPNMARLAAPYADALRAHAGTSACVVAGYSFAGKIAFEVAHALQREGGNVAFVLLIDTIAWAGGARLRSYMWQSLRWIWGGAASGVTNDTRLASIQRAARQFVALAALAARANTQCSRAPPRAFASARD